MRLIFPKTSKRTSLWQGQTHWELMYFFWLWRETGERDLYEGHRNTNYKSRLMSSKYHTVKWLLFSSSQFSEQSKTFGALVWHICLPDPSLPWGSNPQAGEFLVSKMRSCLLCEHRANTVSKQSTGDTCRVKQEEGKEAASGVSWLQCFVEEPGTWARTINVPSSDKSGTKYPNNIRNLIFCLIHNII